MKDTTKIILKVLELIGLIFALTFLIQHIIEEVMK